MNHLGSATLSSACGRQGSGPASNLRELEEKAARIPEESLLPRERNHFSNWLMARSEIGLLRFRKVQASEFSSGEEMREYIVSNLHGLRRWRKKGGRSVQQVYFDPDVSDFVKIGQGSLEERREVSLHVGLFRRIGDL